MPRQTTVDKNLLQLLISLFEGLLAIGARPQRGRLPNAVEQGECQRVFGQIKTRVTYETHNDLLKELWVSFYKDEPFTGPNEMWSRCGFQQKDPVSDIRGGGELAVRNLIYVMQVYPSLYKDVYSRLQNVELELFYPFAVAGINATIMLASIFDVVRPFGGAGQFAAKRLPFWQLIKRESFNELFCVVLELVEHEYANCHATYMEFNAVLKKCKQLLLDVLQNEHIHSISDVRSALGIPARARARAQSHSPLNVATGEGSQGAEDKAGREAEEQGKEVHSLTAAPRHSHQQRRDRRQKGGVSEKRVKRAPSKRHRCKTDDLLGLNGHNADGPGVQHVHAVAWTAAYSNDGHLMVPDNTAFWSAFGVASHDEAGAGADLCRKTGATKAATQAQHLQQHRCCEQGITPKSCDLLGLADGAMAVSSADDGTCSHDWGTSLATSAQAYEEQNTNFLEAFGLTQACM
jgi:hypothetical protein